MMKRPLKEIVPILETFFEYKYEPSDELTADEEDWLEIMYIVNWAYNKYKFLITIGLDEKGFFPMLNSRGPGVPTMPMPKEYERLKTPIDAYRVGIDIAFGSLLSAITKLKKNDRGN